MIITNLYTLAIILYFYTFKSNQNSGYRHLKINSVTSKD